MTSRSISILLSERFDVRPRIVPVFGSFDQMLQAADAALLVGNDALGGGGEGRTKGGRHPVSPWGMPTKGYKTRANKRTDSMIIRRRMKSREE